MIRYSLGCEREHLFDGWFRSSDDFETQRKRGLVACPECGSHKVDKTLMAPAVSTGGKKEKVALAADDERRAMMEKLAELSRRLREDADYVGPDFAEEARKIHFGETDPRSIYGEASSEEVKELLEDGVGVMPLPALPEDRN